MLTEGGKLPKISLYVDVRPSSAFTQGYAFVNSNGEISPVPFHDFWLNIPLYRTCEVMEYVDVQKDEVIQPIQRQEINPFYLEYAFFDNIDRNKVNNGDQLTDIMINFILSNRPDLAGMSNQQVRSWYDYVGKNELPWSIDDGTIITVDDIEKSHIILTSIVSKAKTLNIDIPSSNAIP